MFVCCCSCVCVWACACVRVCVCVCVCVCVFFFLGGGSLIDPKFFFGSPTVSIFSLKIPVFWDIVLKNSAKASVTKKPIVGETNYDVILWVTAVTANGSVPKRLSTNHRSEGKGEPEMGFEPQTRTRRPSS